MPENMPVLMVYVSPGVLVDAGGWYIDAQGHIHRIPPWNPEVQTKFNAAAHALAQATAINDHAISTQFEHVAENVMRTAQPEIAQAVRRSRG